MLIKEAHQREIPQEEEEEDDDDDDDEGATIKPSPSSNKGNE